jgi:hypothetical protein
MTLSNSKVNTTGTGANGIFAYGSGSEINVSNTTVTCTAQLSHAVMASGGGKLTVSNVNMDTSGANSGAIATDRGGGTISVTGGNVTTSGADAPGIYSTGTITVSGAPISATGSESAVIEGANSIALTNTSLTSSKANKWGVLIYQSMSGDAEGHRNLLTMTGVPLSYATDGPLFMSQIYRIITLKSVKRYSASATLILQHRQLGYGGSNGGKVNFTADGRACGQILLICSSTITAFFRQFITERYINLPIAQCNKSTMDSTRYMECYADFIHIPTDTEDFRTTITNIQQ